MRILKFSICIIGGILIILTLRYLYPFVSYFFVDLEGLKQFFLPKVTINKSGNIKIHEICKIKNLGSNFYFSNNKNKIAYLTANNNLTIFDIDTRKESNIYQFHRNHYNQNFSKDCKPNPTAPKIMWSPDDAKILFADFPDLFIYDFINNSVYKVGDFKLDDRNKDFLGSEYFLYSMHYNWLGSDSIIYTSSPYPMYYKPGDGYKYQIKKIKNGLIREIVLEYAYMKVDDLYWSEAMGALTSRIPYLSKLSIDALQHFSGVPDDKTGVDIEVIVNENMNLEYIIQVKPSPSSRRVISLQIKDPEACLGLVDRITQEPAFLEFDKEKLKSSIDFILKRFLLFLIYPDGTTAYKRFEGIKSYDGKLTFLFNKDRSSIFLHDHSSQEVKNIPLKILFYGILPSEFNSCAWLSNKYILFYGKHYNLAGEGMYGLNIQTQEVRKYADGRPLMFNPSPNGKKVILEYNSHKYYSGDAEKYRYDNLILFRDDGQKTFLFKILASKGEILSSSWSKDSKEFCFITTGKNKSDESTVWLAEFGDARY